MRPGLLLPAFIALVLSTPTVAEDGVPAAVIPPAKYGRWAHLHWVWNHNAYSNQGNVTELIRDYLSRGIKVGAVNIDSTWATQFNNFEVNPAKFSDFPKMIEEIHQQNIKVVMWVTSMVNVESPDYAEAVAKQYLVRSAKTGDVVPIEWWHGEGGLLDYTSPEAVAWWHARMDRVLKLPNGDGIDGWKCDGTDPYLAEYFLKQDGALGYKDKPYESTSEYSDLYYRDFQTYTRSQRGANDGLIMARPVDCLQDQTSTFCWGYAPLDVMTSGWVGDDDSTWNGLRGAARKVIYSAWDGYANFAFDVGGYREQSPAPAFADAKELFIRWAQLGAFLPLMENGGGGEHKPWAYDDETTDIYRSLVSHHTRLSYYLQSVGSAALESGISTITPQESKAPIRARSRRHYPQPTDFSYTLGPDIFVHPILHAASSASASAPNHTSERERDYQVLRVTFPSSKADAGGTVWLDYWNPADAQSARKGGETSLRVVRGLSDYPVWVRQGALIPLCVDDASSPSSELLLFAWFSPTFTGDGVEPAAFDLREFPEDGPGMSVRAAFTSPDKMRATLSGHKGRAGFRLAGLSAAQVEVVNAPEGCAIDSGLSVEGLTIVCADLSSGAIIDFALTGKA